MKIRYYEYDKKWLYDRKENKLFEITGNECELCKFGIVQLTKFCPYVKETGKYEENPYKEIKRTER